MQGNFKLVFAHCFKRTFRQAHIGFFGLNTQSTDGFGNIGIGYRAEQAAVHTGFLRNGNGLTVQLGFTRLGIGQNGGLFRFQFGAALVIKATKVDGVYTADPKKDAQATRYARLSFDEAMTKNLGIMDATAFALCRDQKLPIKVFSIFKPGALKAVVMGADEGTLVHV